MAKKPASTKYNPERHKLHIVVATGKKAISQA